MFPRKVGSAWEIFTPAKLNLYLEVLGPKSEGFHPLETLMTPVRIFDQIRWMPGSPGRLKPKLQICNLLATSRGPAISLGPQPDNLVMRAAEKLARSAGVEHHGTFQLVKRIPVQAGLGGGSSDAAATLQLLNVAWNIHYDPSRLRQLAAELGSDVPFFVGSGPAICRGRGEQIERVAGLPRLALVIVKPPVGLSTQQVFDRLHNDGLPSVDQQLPSAKRLALLVSALRRGALADAGQRIFNRLEAVAEQLTPWIVRLRQVFNQCGCHGHFMTGSGTAYAGVMRSAKQARLVARSLACRDLGSIFATSSC
ncbi:MAG: 4-(cytidine 5'-diphospho)-2-C-methyl-D-erythritol kinase [Planctomycetales bacterium]|nr:4-(cytidine 5'-diphospho)-2-C-methyl-D-erythritol kinase [Planctomycetales bacterium]